MVGAVVFDMDGVILDSEQLVVRSWQKIAGKYGIEYRRFLHGGTWTQPRGGKEAVCSDV